MIVFFLRYENRKDLISIFIMLIEERRMKKSSKNNQIEELMLKVFLQNKIGKSSDDSIRISEN